jgi:hypothetical protein
MLMNGSKIPRIEFNTVHLYQHYSLFIPNKLQYIGRGDYCECVLPAQLPVLIEVQAPSPVEQHPRYVPHRDRAGYNRIMFKRPFSSFLITLPNNAHKYADTKA